MGTLAARGASRIRDDPDAAAGSYGEQRSIPG